MTPASSSFRRRADPPPLWADNVIDLLPETAAAPLGRALWVAELPVLVMAPRSSQPWLAGYPRTIHIRDTAGERDPGRGILGLKTSPIGGQASAFEYLKQAVVDNALSRTGSRHLWAWSTTEVDELLVFIEWLRQTHTMEVPPNIWLGTRIQSASDLNRLPILLRAGTPNTKRFMILEPTVELVDVRRCLGGIDWCIAGQLPQPNSRLFDVDAARQLRDACRRARTALFLTAIGSSASPIKTKGGTNWYLWPDDLQIRVYPDPTCQLPGRNPEAKIRAIRAFSRGCLDFAIARYSPPVFSS